MLLCTVLLGFAGAAVHKSYERLLVGVVGGLIRVVEPRDQDTLLTVVAGGVRVDPPYADMDPFVIQSLQMHVSAPLILALLLVGGRKRIGLSRRAGRVAAGAVLVFAVHVVALITQLELSPLKAAGFRDPSYYVFRFSWWVGTVWSLLVLPAGAALYVYLADFHPLPRASDPPHRGRPFLLGLAGVAGAVIVLAVTLAHLRPQRLTEARVVAAQDPGIEAFHAGQYARAVESFRSRLQDGSGSAEVRFNLGVSLYRMGRFADAIREFRLLRSLQPDYPGLEVSLGAALFDGGQRKDALEAFRRADLQRETDMDLLLRVGEALSGGGDLQSAQHAYARVLELAPGNAEALYRLGTLVMAQGQGERAVEYFTQALGVRPDYLKAQKYLAVAHQQAGRVAEAQAAYQKALDLAPLDQGALFGAAVLLLRTDDPCGALQLLQRCVQASGSDTDTRRCRQLLQQIETSCPA